MMFPIENFNMIIRKNFNGREMTGIEIERKFLVKDDGFKAEAVESHHLVQGYICRESGRTVRVRIADDRAYLTIKGRSSDNGMSRFEWETGIPVGDARRLLALCQGGTVDKTRYIVPVSERKWEVDEFHGDNEGLVVAEIELGSEDEPFGRPSWLGEEVTGDRRYYNSMLSECPYKKWQDASLP